MIAYIYSMSGINNNTEGGTMTAAQRLSEMAAEISKIQETIKSQTNTLAKHIRLVSKWKHKEVSHISEAIYWEAKSIYFKW